MKNGILVFNHGNASVRIRVAQDGARLIMAKGNLGDIGKCMKTAMELIKADRRIKVNA